MLSGLAFVGSARGWFIPDSPTTFKHAIVALATREVANHEIPEDKLLVEEAVLTTCPQVPPAITRKHPVKLIVKLNTTVEQLRISPTKTTEMWTFNGSVPGPFIRARVGDSMEVQYTNNDCNGIGHNIDFHAVTGPGGGAPALYAEQGETKIGTFRLLQPGLFIYHCAAGPVPVHVARGMYGLLLVEPADGLPKVDREFAVVQSEIYGDPSKDGKTLEFSYEKGVDENATMVVFNGREGALTENPLTCKVGERVRLFVGNGGPSLTSAFHVIGSVFDRVYREGDLITPPARGLQIAMVPPGGSSVVEFDAIVPGNYSLVDHAIYRIEKGCIGFLKVLGEPRQDVYRSSDTPTQCPGCKLHN